MARNRHTPLLAPLAALFLAGCSNQQGGIWSQYGQMLRHGFGGTFGTQRITMEQAAAVPYASLAYRVDGGREQMLVLATNTQGQQIWTASSHVVLLTENGRILRTVGLPHDRGGTAPTAGESLRPLSDALRETYRSTRLVDLPEAGIYGMRLACTTARRGAESVIILGTAIATVKVEEACQSEDRRWSFTDAYWLDGASGFVWRSFQHLHPAGTRVQVTILRPPE